MIHMHAQEYYSDVHVFFIYIKKMFLCNILKVKSIFEFTTYLTISIQYCSLCCPVEFVNALVHLISVGLCLNVG